MYKIIVSFVVCFGISVNGRPIPNIDLGNVYISNLLIKVNFHLWQTWSVTSTEMELNISCRIIFNTRRIFSPGSFHTKTLSHIHPIRHEVIELLVSSSANNTTNATITNTAKCTQPTIAKPKSLGGQRSCEHGIGEYLMEKSKPAVVATAKNDWLTNNNRCKILAVHGQRHCRPADADWSTCAKWTTGCRLSNGRRLTWLSRVVVK